MNDPKLVLLEDLMKRTHELELQLQVPFIDYKQIRAAELYAAYCKVLVDQGLMICYNDLYKKERKTENERKLET